MGDPAFMTRKKRAAFAALVGLADVVSIVILTAFLQTWVDSRLDAPPPALPILWKVLFFPARYGLRLPPFDHPLGFGGPGDDVVWGSLDTAERCAMGGPVLLFLAQSQKLISRSAIYER